MMKYILKIILILTAFGCKAQQITKPIYKTYETKNGVYYKDVDNDFSKFEGTWLYTDGNTSLTIMFKKKMKGHVKNVFSDYYTDALVGEYQYIENGVEKVNTLANLNVNHEDPSYYNIDGESISKFGDRSCDNCTASNQIKVRSSFSEPNCKIFGSSPEMIFRYYTENGVEKIDCGFRGGGMRAGGLNGENLDTCDKYTLPFGGYTLIKQ